jgi:FdrA protein
VSCLIPNAGAGVSQAIGTGGRDVKKEVGRIMFIQALKALAQDEQTRVILLVSKPPHAKVVSRIQAVVKKIRKPIVAEKVALELRGIAHEDVKGDYSGLCFAGQPEA